MVSRKSVKAAALLFAILFILSCSLMPPKNQVETYMEQYGGEPGAYAEIITLTDCKALQAKFDTAANNNGRESPGTKLFKATLGYMKAADERLKELGCYK